MGIGGSLPGGKAVGSVADQSPPTSAEVKTTRIYTFTPHEAVWGSGGIALPILTSALDGGEWSASRPGRFTPVPIGQEVGWAPEPVGTL
jgi:hypothetical protein